MSEDYFDQLKNNDESKEPGYEHWVHEEFGKLGSGKDAISYYPFFQGGKDEIASIRRQLNKIRNTLGMSKTASNNYMFMAGMDAVSKELEGQNPRLDAEANLRADKQRIQERQSLRKELREMYKMIDGIDYTQERFNETAIGLGFDPVEFENTFTMEIPKSEAIRHFFFNNIIKPMDIIEIKKLLEDSSIVSNDKDWSLAKNIASRLSMSGKVRGKWCQPNED